MAIRIRPIPKHWNYFLSIEEDVVALTRWIEFHEDNFGCYSIQLARLLMVAAAETDVVAKGLCAHIDKEAKAQSINHYRDVIIGMYPRLPKAVVEMPKYGLKLKPWVRWGRPENPPIWWTANNHVKHHRNDKFNEATLENALNAVAGLFLLLALYYGRRTSSIQPAPNLLNTHDYAYMDGDVLVFKNGG